MVENGGFYHRLETAGKGPHIITALKLTFKDFKGFERETLRYCKGDGKFTFTRPFLVLHKVT